MFLSTDSNEKLKAQLLKKFEIKENHYSLFDLFGRNDETAMQKLKCFKI